ncbi:MAG TPA: AI-2E family transporter [Gallionellaceae bacterium]|nr:AI-2E family transporter [Gallionellaceae bacterium]
MTLERFVALQWLAIVAVCAWLVYLLSPILTPFVAAAILAYICDPLVKRLARHRLSRTTATFLVMLALLGVLVLLVLIMLPLLQREATMFVSRLPELVDAIRIKLLPWLRQFGITLPGDVSVLRGLLLTNLQGAGGAAAGMLPWLGGGSTALLAVVMNVLLTPVALFYMLRDWPILLERIEQLLPRNQHEYIHGLVAEVDRVLAEFLRGQLAVMLLMSGYYLIGLHLAGLEFALPIGLVAGLLVFVPYLGMTTGLVLATLAALTQFDHFTGVLLVWAVFASGQLLEGMVVTPKLVGERIGLHPLAVIFALLAFGQVFGFFGVLLALPLSAILLVTLRHAREWYLHSTLYRG